MLVRSRVFPWILSLAALVAAAQTTPDKREVALPSSKKLLAPLPGSPQRTNSFPTAVALSPDGKYLAILNNGYGTAESKFQQSIALLDLTNNQLRDFPDSRLALDARQTYFLGLAWSSDGTELYASMASLTDPEGKSGGDTGNGIAVYGVANGTLTPQRFLKLPLVTLPKGKRFTYYAKSVAPGQAIPYPAGLAVVKRDGGDALLIAENLADDAVLLDAQTGSVLQRFDLSVGKYVPTGFPYGVVASRDGTRAWCSSVECIAGDGAGLALRESCAPNRAHAAQERDRCVVASDRAAGQPRWATPLHSALEPRRDCSDLHHGRKGRAIS